MKVFLGGSCSGSKWRENLIPKLKINYFNPDIRKWDALAFHEEKKQREECDIMLYVFTPTSTTISMIAQLVDDSNKQPAKTIFHYMIVDGKDIFQPHEQKALSGLGKLINDNGALWFEYMEDLIIYLNSSA